MCKILQTNRTIRNINLSSNNIGNDGAHALFASLEDSYHVESLNLSDNRINDNAAKDVGR